MNLRNRPIDPLDPSDPRVVQEWEDSAGQTVRVGDMVVIRGWRAMEFGKVLCIHAKRKDGRRFNNGGPHLEIHEYHNGKPVWFSTNPYIYTAGTLKDADTAGPPPPRPLTRMILRPWVDVVKIDKVRPR